MAIELGLISIYLFKCLQLLAAPCIRLPTFVAQDCGAEVRSRDLKKCGPFSVLRLERSGGSRVGITDAPNLLGIPIDDWCWVTYTLAALR